MIIMFEIICVIIAHVRPTMFESPITVKNFLAFVMLPVFLIKVFIVKIIGSIYAAQKYIPADPWIMANSQ